MLCYVLEKGESEPSIKCCLGRTVGLVQRFTTMQNFGHNWWRADGMRVEYFPRIHHIAARRQSPRVHEHYGRPSSIPRTNYLHVDVQWHHVGIWRQWTGMHCNCATLVPLFAKRFPAGRWSFYGPGSEKKWYSTYIDRPRGEWARVAESMMIRFGESGHPVFRATSPLSRGTLKSKGGVKLSMPFCADEGTIETVFRTIISVNHLSIYGAVSDLCDEYPSTGNLCSCSFVLEVNQFMQLQFLTPVELFLSSWTVAVFDLGGIMNLWFAVFPLCGLSWLHFEKEGNIQPFWKVRGAEQHTS